MHLRVFAVCAALAAISGASGALCAVRAEEPRGPAPRAVVAWPAGPLEVRVAFDRPVPPALVGQLTGQFIEFSAMSQRQVSDPANGKLRIAAAKLADGGRTLVLATDPHAGPLNYSLRMPPEKPGAGAGASKGRGAGEGSTSLVMYTLSGVEASWSDKPDADEDAPVWQGWWPLLDPSAVRARMAGSVEHECSAALLAKAGKLTLRTLLALPEGKAEVLLESSAPFEAELVGDDPVKSATAGAGGTTQRASLAFEAAREPAELVIRMRTNAGGPVPTLNAHLHNEAEPAARPLRASSLLVPWAPSPAPEAAAPAPLPPALTGGDRTRGEAVFFSEQARCSSCHKIQGKGGEIGPDLSKLSERDAASLYRDINDPSAIVNPEFVSHTVALTDGRVAMGIVHTEDFETIRVVDTDAKQTVIKRADIEELRPSRSSIMPAGLVGSLGEAKMRDLLAFLLAPAARPQAPGAGGRSAR